MKEVDKELIDEIKNLFEDYEEEYAPQEWAKFQAGKRPAKPIYPLWMKIAAIFVLICGAVWMLKPGQVSNSDFSKDIVKSPALDTSKSPAESQVSSELLARLGETLESQPARESRGEHLISVPNAIENPVIQKISTDTLQENSLEGSLANAVQSKTQQADEPLKTPERGKTEVSKTDLTLEFLLKESQKKTMLANRNQQQSKWDFGLGVIPTVSNSKLNVGAGVSTTYALSDKFSLSTGISVYDLESGTQVGSEVSFNSPVQGEGVFSFSDQKKYEGTNAIIKAIDIPLALVYKLNKNFYTSAGFSYVNVLTERRNNTFTRNALVQRSTVDPFTGAESFNVAMAAERISEPESITPLKGNSYMGGFLNFSVGRRQQIFQKYDIRVEPFLKIPVGRLSKEDVQLMNSGVKLQFVF